ncbi:MAG TPA: S24 family peptidase [Streptosporangiaceae bacterium]|nr:S24 family peptidase [Streptosporangiaceae bacterium]
MKPHVRWPLVRVAVAELSMSPVLEPGDWIVVLRAKTARPGQLVIARHPAQPEMLLVKRLIRRVPEGGWYLLSANPAVAAVDSRRFGPVAALEGRVLFRYRRAPIITKQA